MEQPPTPQSDPRTAATRGLVVAAAVLHGSRVLAARRTAPPALAGRWELPGGKVEPGEDPAHAVVRELGEELGCTVRVTGWLPGRTVVGPTLDLLVCTAVLVEGRPAAGEHDRLRWLGRAELGDVDWLEPDRPFLAALAALLPARGGPPDPSSRAVFGDREGAEAAAEELRAAGHRAEVARERLAGEDDDEDHPWAVLADVAPEVLAACAEPYDGWVEAAPEAGLDPGASAAPTTLPPLPTAPRRFTRP